jgi:hypothetical protein
MSAHVVTSYPIGVPAANILAVNLDKTGKVYLYQKSYNGTKVGAWNPEQIGDGTIGFSFLATAGPGSVTVSPMTWDDPYEIATFSLKNNQPFEDGEAEKFTTYPSNGGVGNAAQIFFQGSRLLVGWQYSVLSGSCALGPIYPELSLVMRLPPKSSGSLSFMGVSFTPTAGGAKVSQISV